MHIKVEEVHDLTLVGGVDQHRVIEEYNHHEVMKWTDHHKVIKVVVERGNRHVIYMILKGLDYHVEEGEWISKW